MASASDVFSGRSRYSLVVTSNQLSQNIAGNYSTVSINVRIVETTENGTWSNNSAPWNCFVNGSGNSGTLHGFDFRTTDSVTLFNSTKTVGHNADGTKSYSFNSSFGSGTVLGTAYAVGSNTLSTIPRASTSTWAPGTGTTYAGGTYQLNTNRASTGFTHNITYSFGGASGTIGNGVGGSVNWTIPMSLLDRIPNSVTGTGVITTRTYSGGTHIGTTTSNFAVTAPSSVIPTWDSVSTNEAVADVTTKVGAYVQGVSKIFYSINGAEGVYSSTITQHEFKVAGQTVNGATGTTPNPISASGTVPAVFTITDSRGRKKTQTNNLTVLPYSSPKINSLSVARALSDGTPDPDDGTYLRITLNTNVQSLVNGTQRNSVTIRVYTKLKTSSTWTLQHTETPGAISYNASFTVAGPFDVDQSYDVRVESSDIFNTSAAQTTVAVAAVFMHWGNGLGVNKFHEQGALDVGGDIYQKNRKVYSYQQTVKFTSSGTFTKATYPWLAAVRVRLVGAGGAGGGAFAGGSGHSSGGGGGGGGYAESFIPVASVPSSVTVTVGAEGVGSSAASGGDGGATSFGSLVSASGGGGGHTYAANTLMIGGVSGDGGVGTAGDLLSSGSPGIMGSGYATLAHGGNGGDSLLGGGGRGSYAGASGASSDGVSGGHYGSGGSGARSNASGTAQSGGNGSPGIVIVELYS